MSLLVWLPLNGDLQNKGLGDDTPTISGTSVAVNNNGKIGKCYSFGTDNGYLEVPTTEVKKLTNFCSIAFWVKILSFNVNYTTIFSCTSGNTDWNHQILTFQRNNNGSNYTFHIANGSRSTINLCKTDDLQLNTWYHFVLIMDVQNGQMKIYKNGSLITIYNTSIVPNYASIQYFRIAKSHTSYQGHFLLNDFRLYDHCLSLKQIKQLSKGLVLHYPLDNNGLGNINSNLLLGTSKKEFTTTCNTASDRNKGILSVGSGGNGTFSITQDDTVPVGKYSYNVLNNTSGNRDFQQGGIPFQDGKTYTGSWWAKGNGTCLYRSWNRTDGKQMFQKTFVLTQDWVFYSYTFTVTEEYETDDCTWQLGVTGSANIYMAGMKLEESSQATPWIPNQNDPEYSALGYDDTTIYDCSGYQNNGIANNITYSTNTPKYLSSSQFTSVNTSYIKVNENNWMAQHAKEMTVNFWAYAENWTTQSKLFSCTESGGFNTQSGSSGYLRFPVYVCTNEAQTSYGYKYDSKQIKNSDLSSGWHMFTFIYEAATGTKTYIDGQLHHTYNNVSYGIRFNTNARLFLGCQAASANPTAPYFNGKQSDFRLYYTCLSEKDIKELYSVRASGDRDSNFYSSGKFIEQGQSNQIEHLYDIEKTGSYTGTIIKDENGIHLNDYIWVNHDFIPINPVNKTYKYDITFSNTDGNMFYIGWERYDANKTSRSNNACIYVQGNKTARDYYRIQGTVDLSTDGVNPCAFIRIRILNKWSGSTSDTEGKATIHSLSLKEFSSSDNFEKMKISHQGNTFTTELQQKNKIFTYITRAQELNANSFIEN